MALKRRYLLTADCFLNNQLVEAGKVILWDPAAKNNAMVECDAKGRPLSRTAAVEQEPVQILDVQPVEAKPEAVVLDEDQRANLIAVAVQDVLDNDNEADWTKQNEIRIDVIRKATGLEDVSRDEIKAALDAIEESAEEAAETETAKAAAAARKD